MIVCDRDGVVIIPFDRINKFFSKLSLLKVGEAEVESKITSGLKKFEYIAGLMASQEILYVE
jgi:hypothetical protein